MGALAAYCFDAAVMSGFRIVENALAEEVNDGDTKHPRWRKRWTFKQIVDPNFFLPDPSGKSAKVIHTKDGKVVLPPEFFALPPGAMPLASLVGQRGVKLWHVKGSPGGKTI